MFATWQLWLSFITVKQSSLAHYSCMSYVKQTEPGKLRMMVVALSWHTFKCSHLPRFSVNVGKTWTCGPGHLI